MAKKKSKPAKKSTPKKSAKRPLKPLRQPTLPGAGQVRNRSLDRICENISDVRHDKNRLIGEEKDLMNQAVTAMTKDKVTVYRYSGVELVLVPGDVHLRVRTLKDKANTDAEPAEAREPDTAGITAEEMQTPDDERLAEQGDEA